MVERHVMEIIWKKLIKKMHISIYLEGGTATMIERLIRKKAKRPLIASLGDDKIPEFVAKHLFERRPFYEQAKMKIKIDNKTKKEVALELENY